MSTAASQSCCVLPRRVCDESVSARAWSFQSRVPVSQRRLAPFHPAPARPRVRTPKPAAADGARRAARQAQFRAVVTRRFNALHTHEGLARSPSTLSWYRPASQCAARHTVLNRCRGCRAGWLPVCDTERVSSSWPRKSPLLPQCNNTSNPDRPTSVRQCPAPRSPFWFFSASCAQNNTQRSDQRRAHRVAAWCTGASAARSAAASRVVPAGFCETLHARSCRHLHLRARHWRTVRKPANPPPENQNGKWRKPNAHSCWHVRRLDDQDFQRRRKWRNRRACM